MRRRRLAYCRLPVAGTMRASRAPNLKEQTYIKYISTLKLKIHPMPTPTRRCVHPSPQTLESRIIHASRLVAGPCLSLSSTLTMVVAVASTMRNRMDGLVIAKIAGHPARLLPRIIGVLPHRPARSDRRATQDRPARISRSFFSAGKQSR